jgi:hypothetical protein
VQPCYFAIDVWHYVLWKFFKEIGRVHIVLVILCDKQTHKGKYFARR